MLEEMRWLEYGQRLRAERRGVLTDPAGSVASRLIESATLAGARSLSLPVGAIATGLWADFAVIDLGHASLAGADEENLAETLVFGADDDVLVDTWVGGLEGARRAAD